jgi:hypothetical protein
MQRAGQKGWLMGGHRGGGWRRPHSGKPRAVGAGQRVAAHREDGRVRANHCGGVDAAEGRTQA